MPDLLNPDAVSGHNEAPDYAAMETARLEQDYIGLLDTFTSLEAEFARVPMEVNDDATALRIGGLIKRFRDLRTRLEQARLVEVEPHLRRQNADNTFFNSRKRSIQPEEKNERRVNPGFVDNLQKRIDDHQDRKEAEERAARAAAAAEQKRIADEAAAEQRRKDKEAADAKRAADEATAAAERARTEQSRAARKAEADAAAAEAARLAGEAARAQSEAQTAAQAHTDSHISTLATSADLVRVQGNNDDGGGVTLTSKKEPYCIMTDRSLLNTPEAAAKLIKYFNDKEVEKALRGWARETNHNEPMPGAEIGWRKAGVTR